jgi:hypothetical protein
VQVSGVLGARTLCRQQWREPLRLDLEAGLTLPSLTVSNSALLRLLRSRTTCKNVLLHSGKRVIADKD